jgi:LysM repeat protein
MNLHKLILTNNACYKAGRTMTPQGIMVHSTGVNNPYLNRYVGPDDGLLGKGSYNNHWNQDRPDGRQVCVHGFIGKLADGTIATYQTLPWNHRGWHAGGTANNTHISFEICEDGLIDASYFNDVYREAVALCVYLCQQFNLTEMDIICHSEGYKRGIASNHRDVMHWFPKHGKTMAAFRADVKRGLEPAKSAASSGTKTQKQVFRVRKHWSDAKTQKGAFKELGYAKRCANENPGYAVFDATGTKLYTGISASSYDTYTVKTGDSLWTIAAKMLGSGAKYHELRQLNGLTSDVIHAGQKLKIPK